MSALTPGTPAHWTAAEIDAGRTNLQSMLDRSPFPTTAVRTVAATGDFRISDGHVRRVDPSPASWFSDSLIDGRFHLTVTLTPELMEGKGLHAPMALANVLHIPRGGFTSLDSAEGPVPMRLIDDHVLTAPLTKLLGGRQVGDVVELVFDPAGYLEVRG